MRYFLIGVGLIVSLVVMVACLGPLGYEVLGSLLFGWWSYLARVAPRVSIPREGVATGLVCLVLFTIGLHGFLRWFHDEARRSAGTSGQGERRWAFRWSASIVAVVVLMFVTGIASAVIVHQVGWLLASKRPLTAPRLAESHGSSENQLKFIGMGTQTYAGENNNELPVTRVDARGRPLHSWQTEILPYMFFIDGEIDRDLPWNDPRNSAYFRGVVPDYLNPEIGVIRSPDGYALSHYPGNVHLLGKARPFPIGEVVNGTSNTILAGEAPAMFRPWGDPANLRDPAVGINTAPEGFGGPSGNGANILFLDGSVHFFRETTDPAILQRLSRANREDGRDFRWPTGEDPELQVGGTMGDHLKVFNMAIRGVLKA